MDKLENGSRPKYSLFLLSTIDYRNSPLPKNMLSMMLIKMYYTDNPYKIAKRMVDQDWGKWKHGPCILQAHQL